jgi:hypothetical protein
MRYILKDANGIVLNIIEYDGVAPYTIPSGASLTASEDAVAIGKTVEQYAADMAAEAAAAQTVGATGPSGKVGSNVLA